MRVTWWLALAAAVCPALKAQTRSLADLVSVFTDHPRLFLRPARLRLLKRERERASLRWQHLEEAVSAGGLSEPGFAWALYYQVSGDAGMGRRAVEWALGAATDLRQISLVFDWCQDAMSAPQKDALRSKIARSLAAPAGGGLPETSARALAAVALFDDEPDLPRNELRRIVGGWWAGSAAPALAAGKPAVAREDVYALFEFLYAIRDSANLDLRQSCPDYFRWLPIERLLTYYPAVFRDGAADFRAGAAAAPETPDPRAAATSRAADLAMAGYDPNLEENQYLQGWLARDRFAMSGPFGAAYEFLWSNPYQPGLNYFLAPLVFHDAGGGRLFARSDWQDTAAWIGLFGGVAQRFVDGRAALFDPRAPAVVDLHAAVISFGADDRNFRVTLAEGGKLYAAALSPLREYRIQVDDGKAYDDASDPGGVLELRAPTGREIGVRIRRAPAR